MSAASSHFSEYGLAGLRMRAEEYFALGVTQERYELVNGVVMMSPSPRPRHWKMIQAVILQLAEFERAGGKVDIYCKTDLRIDDLDVFRPDICVYASLSGGTIPERLTAPPDLVVEVLSPGTEAFDLVTKKDEYELRAVKEYWVIDPVDARVRAWHREGNRFLETPVEGGSLASRAITGFMLDLQRLARATGRG